MIRPNSFDFNALKSIVLCVYIVHITKSEDIFRRKYSREKSLSKIKNEKTTVHVIRHSVLRMYNIIITPRIEGKQKRKQWAFNYNFINLLIVPIEAHCGTYSAQQYSCEHIASFAKHNTHHYLYGLNAVYVNTTTVRYKSREM
jgi:hypothetical protein